jgi:hypothetical protein
MPIYNPSASGGSATVVAQYDAPQVNVSSAGVTTTDTVGNTYAEPAGQTRITADSDRSRVPCAKISGHVDAGTGTFQLWNQSTSTSIATRTTTATGEAALASLDGAITTLAAAALLTLRVKNSGAGGTVTIDAGGMVLADDGGTAAGQQPTATGTGQTPFSEAAASPSKFGPGGVWFSKTSIVLLKAFSTGTISTTFGFIAPTTVGTAVFANFTSLSGVLTEANANVATVANPAVKIGAIGAFIMKTTAISTAGHFWASFGYELSADDI